MKRKANELPTGALRYVGGGAYLPHVPARDLSAEEAAQHRNVIEEAQANGQRLYVPAETGEAKEEG